MNRIDEALTLAHTILAAIRAGTTDANVALSAGCVALAEVAHEANTPRSTFLMVCAAAYDFNAIASAGAAANDDVELTDAELAVAKSSGGGDAA